MSALDWGGGNGVNSAPRYYTFNSPTLPNSDWSIGIWMRRSHADNDGSNFQRLWCIGTSDNTDSAYVWLGDVGFSLAWGVDVINSAGATLMNAADGTPPSQDGNDRLTVLQRVGSTLEIYVVTENTAAVALDVETGVTGTISAQNANIGVAAGVGDHNRNPLGEFFIFTDRSLTATQITHLAAGNTPLIVATPAVYLPFRSGAVATELNLGTGGNINNATQVGSGWTTTTDFFPLPSTAQILTPNADKVTGNWSASTGATLFACIDETVRDDTDYAVLTGIVGSTFRVALSSANDPSQSTNHVVSYAITGMQGNMNVRLIQDANTTIAQWAHVPIAHNFTQFDQTLSNAQADAITNYANLYLEFIAY